MVKVLLSRKGTTLSVKKETLQGKSITLFRIWMLQYLALHIFLHQIAYSERFSSSECPKVRIPAGCVWQIRGPVHKVCRSYHLEGDQRLPNDCVMWPCCLRQFIDLMSNISGFFLKPVDINTKAPVFVKVKVRDSSFSSHVTMIVNKWEDITPENFWKYVVAKQ